MLGKFRTRSYRTPTQHAPSLTQRYLHSLNREIYEQRLEDVRSKKGFICDLGGTIYKGIALIEGVAPFIRWLQHNRKRVIFMTNTSIMSKDFIQAKLYKLGLEVPSEAIFTSTMATARFIQSQSPNCTAFVLGEQCLLDELTSVGITLSDESPDYVVVGEKESYSHAGLKKAMNHVRRGAKLIGTNPDLLENIDFGHLEPSCGAWISIIEKACSTTAYFVGKPNPLMYREALNKLGLHAAETTVIGDNMNTDILAGVEAGISTVLVLTGVSKDFEKSKKNKFSWLPYLAVDDIGSIATEDFHQKQTRSNKDPYFDSVTERLKIVPEQLL